MHLSQFFCCVFLRLRMKQAKIVDYFSDVHVALRSLAIRRNKRTRRLRSLLRLNEQFNSILVYVIALLCSLT